MISGTEAAGTSKRERSKEDGGEEDGEGKADEVRTRKEAGKNTPRTELFVSENTTLLLLYFLAEGSQI